MEGVPGDRDSYSDLSLHEAADPGRRCSLPWAVMLLPLRGDWRGIQSVMGDPKQGSYLICIPKAKRLLITADVGGSNGSRLRLWKWELQRLADELRLPMSVCHFPPGTSKWNKVEHRLFSFISSNWRGEPLADYATVVNLIAKTTTTTGLKVSCRLDRRRYPTGRKVSDEEWAKINLHRDDFHGDWNYTIRPRRKR